MQTAHTRLARTPAPAVVDDPHHIDRSACPAVHHHGDRSAYNNAGCRCPDAREDRRRYDRQWATGTLEADTVDGTGTRRRLEALAAIGWPVEHLAGRLSASPRSVRRWRQQTTVPRHLAERVTALYDALSMIPGPSPSARAHALAAGWAPPLAWEDELIDQPDAAPDRSWRRAHTSMWDVDDIAVELACHGEPFQGRLTFAERICVVHRLAAAGVSVRETARRTGMSVRTVIRLRQRAPVDTTTLVATTSKRTA